MKKPNDRKQLDALALVTRTALQDRRRSPWIAIVLLLLFVAAVVFLASWFIPRARYPQLLLTAYDVVGLPGEETAIRAGLETSDPEQPEDRLADVEVFFQLGMGEWVKRTTASTGFAEMKVSLPANEGITAITARYSGEARKHRAIEARALAFAWPGNSRLVLIDVSSLGDQPGVLDADNPNLDFVVSAKAISALAPLQKTRKIVYWLPGFDSPSSHAKLRNRMALAWMNSASRLPMGPLLGESTEDVGRWLAKRFPEQVVGVTRTKSVAEAWHAVGVRAIWIGGQGKELPGIRVASDWEQCAQIIAKH